MTTQAEKKELAIAAHSEAVGKMRTVVDSSIKAAEDLKLDNAHFKAVVFEQCLPEGLTSDTVKVVREADTAFIAATTQAWGEHSIAAMAKDKGLTETKVKFDMVGGKAVEIQTDREAEVSTGPGNPKKQVFGETGVAVRDTGLKSEDVGFKPIRNALRELGAKKLAK